MSKCGLEMLLDRRGSIHWESECQGPSSMSPLPYSQRSSEDHGDASWYLYLDRSWRIQWNCQNIARSMLGLAGSSPQIQCSRLQTCRLHLKCLGLKDEITERTAEKLNQEQPWPPLHRLNTHTACSAVVYNFLPHCTWRAPLTPPNTGLLSFLPAQIGVEYFFLLSPVKEVGFSGKWRQIFKTHQHQLTTTNC